MAQLKVFKFSVIFILFTMMILNDEMVILNHCIIKIILDQW